VKRLQGDFYYYKVILYQSWENRVGLGVVRSSIPNFYKILTSSIQRDMKCKVICVSTITLQVYMNSNNHKQKIDSI
jgi:hypothetical protein